MTSSALSHDLVIVGAGTVGLALAVALQNCGLRIAVVDARPRSAAQSDARVLALSWGSRQFLHRQGVWQALSPAATAIETIHVSQKGGWGQTRMQAGEYQQPALGYVASAGKLAKVLEDALNPAQVDVFYEQNVSQIESRGCLVTLTTAQGLTLTAQLCARAEGAIPDDPAIESRDYQQHALIATATPQEPHQGIAYERFTSQGPVALLPYGAEFAVVHTATPQDADRLISLSDTEYLAELQAHFGERVVLSAVRERARYPLGLRYRRNPTGARTVWLGNSAQTLHPVAGQGFNLAARDVWGLVSVVQQALAQQDGPLDLGDETLLAAYRQVRQADRAMTIGFTDTLVRTFSNEHPALNLARNAGLQALNLIPPLRHLIAKRMMYGARAWP